MYCHANVDVAAVELTSDRSFRRHTHDQYGVGVLVEGAQSSWSGRGQVEAVAGDVISVNPCEVHDGEPIGAPSRQWRIVYFDPSVVGNVLCVREEQLPEFEFPAITCPDLKLWVDKLFVRVAENEDMLGIEETLLSIFRTLLSTDEKASATMARMPTEEVQRVKERIDDDPAKCVTLRELSDIAGMSRFTLIRAFAAYVGMTPYAYVQQKRLHLARSLLHAGLPIVEVASAAGFSDQSHLNRQFVRQYGISPGQLAAARPI